MDSSLRLGRSVHNRIVRLLKQGYNNALASSTSAVSLYYSFHNYRKLGMFYSFYTMFRYITFIHF